MKAAYQDNLNMLVPYYLMYSYLYYHHNVSLIEDHEYDRICKKILDEWDNIEHRHKSLINKDSLSAGTGYDLEYPLIVQNAALQLKGSEE